MAGVELGTSMARQCLTHILLLESWNWSQCFQLRRVVLIHAFLCKPELWARLINREVRTNRKHLWSTISALFSKREVIMQLERLFIDNVSSDFTWGFFVTHSVARKIAQLSVTCPEMNMSRNDCVAASITLTRESSTCRNDYCSDFFMCCLGYYTMQRFAQFMSQTCNQLQMQSFETSWKKRCLV